MSSRRFISVSLFAAVFAACDARPVQTGASTDALATCTQCHGDATHQNAAPPRGVSGAIDTADPAVGAHQSHLVAGHFRGPILCQDCHVVPATIYEAGHMAGVPASVRFDAPGSSGLAGAHGVTAAIAFSAVDPTHPQGRPDATCTVYCHGVTLDGGTRTRPSWAGAYQAGSTTLDCTSCHGFPPGGGHPKNTACGSCHLGYTSSSVDPSKHVNGALDLIPLTCTSCHGDSTQTATPDAPFWAAPPVDTAGQISSTAVGKHQVHLNGSAISAAIACSECHPVPTTTLHATGTVAFAWGGLATSGGATYVAGNGTITSSPMQVTPAWSGTSASCSATYCHGNYSGTFSFTFFDTPGSWNYSGLSAALAWNGGAMTCGSCHAMPPNNATWHSGYHGANGGNDCQLCHPDAIGTIVPVPGASPSVTGAAITDPTRHVDGVIDLAPQWDSACFGCH